MSINEDVYDQAMDIVAQLSSLEDTGSELNGLVERAGKLLREAKLAPTEIKGVMTDQFDRNLPIHHYTIGQNASGDAMYVTVDGKMDVVIEASHGVPVVRIGQEGGDNLLNIYAGRTGFVVEPDTSPSRRPEPYGLLSDEQKDQGIQLEFTPGSMFYPHD